MAEWTQVDVGRSPSSVVRIVAGRSYYPTLTIPAAICTGALGEHRRVRVMTDGAGRVALAGSPPAPRTLQVNQFNPSRPVESGGARISARGFLNAVGKTVAIGQTVIPHEITDGMLILDLSGLPDAEAL